MGGCLLFLRTITTVFATQKESSVVHAMGGGSKFIYQISVLPLVFVFPQAVAQSP